MAVKESNSSQPDSEHVLRSYHRKVSTRPALRAIGALTRSERAHFESMSKNPDDQEDYLKLRWMRAEDTDSLAAHNAARSLQAVDAMLDGTTDVRTVNRYFLLVHDKDHESRYHWLHENYFRKEIGVMTLRHFDEPVKLPAVSCELPAETFVDKEYTLAKPGIGRLAIVNTFDRYRAPGPDDNPIYFDLEFAGRPFASRYEFDFLPGSESA